MCGRQPDLSKILAWDVVSGDKSLITILTDPSVIDNIIRLRLHLDHPDSFTYVGFSQPMEPAFRSILSSFPHAIPDCMTTYTHFVESNQVVCVVIERKQHFISCAKWYYSNKPKERNHNNPLKLFLRTSLTQILEGKLLLPFPMVVIPQSGDVKWSTRRLMACVMRSCSVLISY
jgi:hypothetical protein